MIDLTKKIQINDTFQITYGRLLLTAIVTTFQFLGLWCGNNWVFFPAMFFLFSNAFLSLEHRKDEQTDLLFEISHLKEELDKIRLEEISRLKEELDKMNLEKLKDIQNKLKRNKIWEKM